MESSLAYLSTFTQESPFVTKTKPKLMELDIAQIEADPQVRKTFRPETIESLAESLKASGQIVAALAYFDEARNKYILIDGERRYRAAIHAKLGFLRAEVWEYKPSEEEVAGYQLAIDHHRESLDPIEQATAFRAVMTFNNWTGSELAKAIKIAQPTVSRALSLLDLPESLQNLIKAGDLQVGIARQLARIEDAALRETAWKKIRSEGLNAEHASVLVNNLLNPKAKSKKPTPKTRYAYRNLSGFDASVSPRKIVLTAQRNGRTSVEILAALETLIQRFRDDIARAEAKSEADARVVTGSEPATQQSTPMTVEHMPA